MGKFVVTECNEILCPDISLKEDFIHKNFSSFVPWRSLVMRETREGQAR